MRFDVKINNFQKLGEYDYKFDEVGNVIINSTSDIFQQNYLSLPLQNIIYDISSIESYYDIGFNEFVPNIKEITGSADVINLREENLLSENENLKKRIDELVKASESNPLLAENDAIKRVILDLRIELNQGKNDQDFSDDFPYMPKILQ